MSTVGTRDPKDLRAKTSCCGRRIDKKQVFRICGWVREYSIPSWAHGEGEYGEWAPPENFSKLKRFD